MKKSNPPSAESIQQVVALGNEGLGNKAIADKVPGVNPNQIAGILHRAGVIRTKKRRKGGKKVSKTQKPVEAPLPVSQIEQVPETEPPMPPKPSPEDLKLLPKTSQCKWPSGDHPIQFLCENTHLPNLPYCASHMRRSRNH